MRPVGLRLSAFCDFRRKSSKESAWGNGHPTSIPAVMGVDRVGTGQVAGPRSPVPLAVDSLAAVTILTSLVGHEPMFRTCG